jgi:outer membrane protein assembly factor BamB
VRTVFPFFLILSIPLLLPPAANASRISLPESTFAGRNQLQAMELELRQHDLDAAMRRVQPLIDEHGDELMDGGKDGDARISVSQYLLAITQQNRDEIRTAYDARYDAVARRALADVQANTMHTPGDLCAVARRYALGSVAPTALAAAANRAADQGDAVSADVLFDMATTAGWHASAAEQARAAAVREIVTAHHGARAPQPHTAFGAAGPLPFDAAWLGAIAAYPAPKFFPVGAQNLALLSSDRYVMAFKQNGLLAWNYSPPKPWGNTSPHFEPGMSGRGATHMPAVFVDADGVPRIVVARQAGTKLPDGCLRALRADDGKLLWTTENTADFNADSFLSPPVIAGRYVFAVAWESTPTSGAIVLIALDVTSGQPIWRCSLATVFDPIHNKDQWRNRDLEDFWQQGPPAVGGDIVAVAPNIGGVFAVGRFDGKLRWMRPYHPTPMSDSLLREYNDGRVRGREMIPPLSKTDYLRWTNTPAIIGSMVVAAPQDTDSVLAVDAVSADLLWENKMLPPVTLAGDSGDGGAPLVAAADQVMALNPASGQPKWIYQPAAGTRLIGPAVPRDGRLVVPTSAGLMSLSPDTGKASPAGADAPYFRSISTSEGGKAALTGAGASTSFGVPPVIRDLGIPRDGKRADQ